MIKLNQELNGLLCSSVSGRKKGILILIYSLSEPTLSATVIRETSRKKSKMQIVNWNIIIRPFQRPASNYTYYRLLLQIVMIRLNLKKNELVWGTVLNWDRRNSRLVCCYLNLIFCILLCKLHFSKFCKCQLFFTIIQIKLLTTGECRLFSPNIRSAELETATIFCSKLRISQCSHR